jgi:hypothetical protein
LLTSCYLFEIFQLFQSSLPLKFKIFLQIKTHKSIYRMRCTCTFRSEWYNLFFSFDIVVYSI